MRNFTIPTILLCTMSLFNQAAMDTHEEHDAMYRTCFCNNDYRKELTDLPDNLLDACQKSGVDPKTIHVFNQNSDIGAHTVGNNIMLGNAFWTFDKDTQSWEFAHELSHVKHKDSVQLFNEQKNLVDFQIGSSTGAGFILTGQILSKHLYNLPPLQRVKVLAGTCGLLVIANIAALHRYYSKSQVMELRANDEAAQAMGAEAGIALCRKLRYERDHGTNANIKDRLHVYKEWLGFCTHGSHELRIERLQAFAKSCPS